MKKLSIFAIFLFILTLNFVVFAALPPKPEKDIFVADFANMIDENTKKEILQMGKTLDKTTGAQVVVVTINSLEGEAIEDYANKLFRKWGIGSKKTNDGVLLLIAKDDRKFRIEVGYGLEGAITDGYAGVILDSMKESFRAKNYSGGILGAYSRILKTVYDEKGVESPENVQTASAKSESEDWDTYDIIYFIIFVIIVGGTVIAEITGGGRRRRRGYTTGGIIWSGSSFDSSFDSSSSSSDSSFGGGSSGGGGSSDDW